MWWVLYVGLGVLFIYALYASWNDESGAFKIEQVGDEYRLMYCHNGEWIFDSLHSSREEAQEKIKHYMLKQAERAALRGWRD